MGFIAASAAWHSSGEYGDLVGDAPVGTPLIVILDHLVLARGCVYGEWEGSWRVVVKMALIWGAAERSETGVLDGPAVMMRLPLAVHLTAASWTCGGVTSLSFLLRVSQISSGRGRPSAGRLKCARSTTRLGLGGLDPATAE